MTQVFKNVTNWSTVAYFKNHENLKDKISETLNQSGPVICEIMIDENQIFAPKLAAKQHADGRITSPSLEDLSPFLSREELIENMIIKLQDE